MIWHIIETGHQCAAFNMAFDEAALTLQTDVNAPLLRLYGWQPPAVTFGYGQDWDTVVDHDACARQGVDIVRRLTGGGAVFHEHEITYSLIAPATFMGDDITESFRNVSSALIAGLRRLGLEAVFAPINDVLVNDKKINGNAQVRRRGLVLQHGTILMRADREKMYSLLRVPDGKWKPKRLARAADRVTDLETELKHTVTFEQATAALADGFTEWLDAPPDPFQPNGEFNNCVKFLANEKYSTIMWNKDRLHKE
jgi:lipoate---protein ligase